MIRLAITSAAESIMPLHMFKEHNFVLTMTSGLITGIAMFGALAYMPTYLQMVTGVNATPAGFLMIPMMGDTNSLTPGAVRDLPDAVREIIVGSYNDARAPVFLYMVPLVLLSAVLLAFVKEVPLATIIKRDEPTDTLTVLGEDDTARK